MTLHKYHLLMLPMDSSINQIHGVLRPQDNYSDIYNVVESDDNLIASCAAGLAGNGAILRAPLLDQNSDAKSFFYPNPQ